MISSPAAEFIERIFGEHRQVLLDLIHKNFYAMHECMLNCFYLPEQASKLLELKKAMPISDFSSAAALFRNKQYLHEKFPAVLKNGNKKLPQISMLNVSQMINKLSSELQRERMKSKIQSTHFNLYSINDFAELVLNINKLRNIHEHESNNYDFSQATMLFGYISRLIGLGPDHVLESISELQTYTERLNNDFLKICGIYIPDESEIPNQSDTSNAEKLDIEKLAQLVAGQVDQIYHEKEVQIKKLEQQLNQKKYFVIDKTKSYYNCDIEDLDLAFHSSPEAAKDTACHATYQYDPEGGFNPIYYIPHGAYQDTTLGHVYLFHDKNDPYFDDNSKEYFMFSKDDIEKSWGPFESPLELIRELSVVYHDNRETAEQYEARQKRDRILFDKSKEKLTQKEKDALDSYRTQQIRIPIKEWKYPQHEKSKIIHTKSSTKKISSNKTDKKPKKNNLSKATNKLPQTIETIIRKTRKDTREELLVLRDKIYTIMTNHTNFDHWDNILSTKIIRNILNNEIFKSSDFKKSKMKPGYLWKTGMNALTYEKRDEESLELMDLQINQFWREIQDITRNYFFDYDLIYNRLRRPWKKTTKEYFEKDYEEHKKLHKRVFNYLNKNNPSLKINHKPFNQFSLSFIKKMDQLIKDNPVDEITFEPVDDGYAIKKIRKLS